MPPHPHDYPARHAHGELDALVVGAAITGAFRPPPTPLATVVPIRPRQLFILGREHCGRCGTDHDVYGVDNLPTDSRDRAVLVRGLR